jgi:hypothetical protein
VSPVLKLQPNKSNDKSWVWNCPADFADGTPTEEIFAIRFVSVNGACLSDFLLLTVSDTLCFLLKPFGVFSTSLGLQHVAVYLFSFFFFLGRADRHFCVQIDAKDFKKHFEDGQAQMEKLGGAVKHDEKPAENKAEEKAAADAAAKAEAAPAAAAETKAN